MIPVVDAYSLFTPTFILVPRKVENDLGEVQKVDFRYHHVTKLLAVVMMMVRLRPGFLYTDNGAQFKALERILSYLTTHTDENITLVRGFPGHPWGRGIVEVVQKLVDAILREQPGFVANENNLASWNKAYETAKLSVDDLNTLLKRHFKKWNYEPRGDQPSRFDIWKNTPQTRRPMPSPERIFHLGFGTDWKMRLVRDTHIEYDNTYWHLKKLDDESRMRWVDAVGKSVPIWSMEYYDDMQGRNITRVFVCLDGRTMDELVRQKSGPTPSPGQRKKNQRGELEVLKRREKALDDIFLALAEKYGTSIPALDTVEKTIIFLDEREESDSGSIPAESAAADEGVTPAGDDPSDAASDGSSDPAVPTSDAASADSPGAEDSETSGTADTPPPASTEQASSAAGDQATERPADQTASDDAPDHAASSQDSPPTQPQQSTSIERLRQRRAQRKKQ
jgi:hypothetical protein